MTTLLNLIIQWFQKKRYCSLAAWFQLRIDVNNNAIMCYCFFRWSTEQPVAYQCWSNYNYGQLCNVSHNNGLVPYDGQVTISNYRKLYDDKETYNVYRIMCNLYDFMKWSTCIYATESNGLMMIKENTTNHLYPVVTASKQCTVLLLSNLAYPQWISIDCDQLRLNHVVCFMEDVKNNTKIIEVSPSLSACPNLTVINKNSCYLFVWFSGQTADTNQLLHICYRNHMMPMNVKQIKYLKFIYEVINQKGFNILTNISISSSHLSMFSYEAFWKNNEIKERIFTVGSATGHFACKKNPDNLNFAHSNIFSCNDRTFLSTLFVCDGRNYCCMKLSREANNDEVGCKNKNKNDISTCSPLYYQSQSGDCFSYHRQSLDIREWNVDKINKAYEATDPIDVQHACLNTTNTDLLNDLIVDCESDNEPLLKQILLYKVKINCQFQDQLPCKEDHPKCFNIMDTCQYKLDKYNHLYPCRTGSHVQQCAEFECNQNFNCPEYYCIPWAYVCDGKWDCPHGFDEVINHNCGINRQCTNMFKCRNSQICVHIYDVCNGHNDCPFKDDEVLCELQYVLCPSVCSCLNFAIMCEETIPKVILFSNMPYVSYHLVFLSLNSSNFLRDQKLLIVLNISGNFIKDICTTVSTLSKLSILDASWNNIKTLTMGCLIDLLYVHLINFHNNTLYSISQKSFKNLGKVHLIDLSFNKLQTISKDTFYNITSVFKLIIKNNDLHNLNSDWLSHAHINILVTNNAHVCCIVPSEILCKTQKHWYTSCTRLLGSFSIKLTFIIISSIVTLINLISFLGNLCVVKRKRKGMLQSIIVIFINIGYLCLGLYLAVIWIGDSYFGDIYAVRIIQWRRNMLCSLGFFLLLEYSINVPCLHSLLLLASLMVTKYPLKSKFKIATFVFKCALGITVSTGTCVFGIGLLTKIYNIFPMTICSSFIDPTDTISLIPYITWFIAICQLIAFTFICTCSVLLMNSLYSAKASIPDLHKSYRKSKTLILKLVIIALANFISWIPSSVIFLSLLFLERYPASLPIWTTVVIVPISSIIVPVILFLLRD